MTIARRLFSAGAAAGLTMVLAGCMGLGGGGNPPARSGRRASKAPGSTRRAPAFRRSHGGIFQTVATDTGQKLAEGSYSLTGPTSVQITGTSLIRQSPISFNCLLISTSQLNCTSSAGQQFVLTRRA